MQFKAALSMVLAGAFLAGTAFAADKAPEPVKQLTPQQQKMKDCNAEAKTKNLMGADRKAFMKTCLSGDSAAAAPAKQTQQEKMKTCSADAKAKSLKGERR